MTRRSLIHLVGQGAGVSAAYATMAAMGFLLTPAPAFSGAPELPAGSGNGKRVAILGAGIAGMTAAYELARAGYECKVIEATRKAGGRNVTFRGGDVVRETGGMQTVDFDPDPDLYFNAGPARLPYHHEAILDYCRKFGVELEPIINDNRGAFFQDDRVFGGKPVRNRQLVNDTRGAIAELLAKAVGKGTLDEDLSLIDRNRFLDFVSRFGDLREDRTYAGSGRSGHQQAPGAGLQAPGKALEPLATENILKLPFWEYQLHFGESFNQAATMLQPRGGMDRIADAFAERVGPMIRYGATVTRIHRSGDGARIVYADERGNEQALEADFVVCTIPFSVLVGIETDFSPEVRQAVHACGYAKAAKAGLQARRRFWELDDRIYGGISWLNDDITQIWYPSAGFGRQKGILVGAYIWTDLIGQRFGAQSFEDRIHAVIAQGSKIHPTIGADIESGVSIAWANVPHQLGAWAEWSPDERSTVYPAVTRPDGPFHFAGEHISYLTGWQEGAALSAHDAVRAIAEANRVRDL